MSASCQSRATIATSALVALLLGLLMLQAGNARAAWPTPPAPSPVKEDPAKRTATSRTYLNDDGSQTAKIFAEPVNYRRPDGTFAPIDNSLVPASKRGFAFRNAANAYTANFPDQASGSTQVRVGSSSVSFGLQGALDEQAKKVGRTVRYEGAQRSVDLIYEPTSEGVKESIMLADPAAPTNFKFEVSTSEGERLIHASVGRTSDMAHQQRDDDLVNRWRRPGNRLRQRRSGGRLEHLDGSRPARPAMGGRQLGQPRSHAL